MSTSRETPVYDSKFKYMFFYQDRDAKRIYNIKTENSFFGTV